MDGDLLMKIMKTYPLLYLRYLVTSRLKVTGGGLSKRGYALQEILLIVGKFGCIFDFLEAAHFIIRHCHVWEFVVPCNTDQ